MLNRGEFVPPGLCPGGGTKSHTQKVGGPWGFSPRRGQFFEDFKISKNVLSELDEHGDHRIQ